jgi:TatD DNase family protein
MFIDSHAHLQMPHYKDDLEDVLRRSQKEGVEGIMLVGSNEEDSLAGIQLAEKHDFLYAGIGIHPHDVKKVNEKTYENLKEMVSKYKVYAYGEIGLDFFKNYSRKELQIEHFNAQIDVADELGLPLIVHIRDAYDECYNIFVDKKDKLKKGGVIHCFSSDFEHAKKFIDLGFLISFSGAITYKNSFEQVNALKNVTTENILIETDCPYLAPAPYRGKRNEPSYIKEIAAFVADVKGLSIEDIARVTSRNFYELFGIERAYDKNEFVYKIRNSLYINLTNRCTNDCTFCARGKSYMVKGHNLKLEKEPSADDVIKLIGDPSEYDEIVFCGYGEPLLRLDEVMTISKYVKEKGGRIRINTNGQANLIHKKNILESLKGLVDAISVSLNAENKEKYNEICHSIFGKDTYNEIKDFTIKAKKVIPKVSVSVVDMPGVDVSACEQVAKQELEVDFKVRKLNVVG